MLQELDENYTKTKDAASKRFPYEKWLEYSEGVYVAESRMNLANRVENEKKKLDKEFGQSEILAKNGHIIFLTPETGNGKQFDGLIDGNHTIDLKKVTGISSDAINRNFKDGVKKAEIVFFEMTNNFSREVVFRNMRGQLKDMLKHGTEIKMKKVWIKIQDEEIYTLYAKDLL